MSAFGRFNVAADKRELRMTVLLNGATMFHVMPFVLSVWVTAESVRVEPVVVTVPEEYVIVPAQLTLPLTVTFPAKVKAFRNAPPPDHVPPVIVTTVVPAVVAPLAVRPPPTLMVEALSIGA
jgi:hypothetical protein